MSTEIEHIEQHHVLTAIKLLKMIGWHPKRNSTKYNLVHEDEEYPPKLVLQIAHAEYKKEKWLSYPGIASGGHPTNEPLRMLGFEIKEKE
ncbi:hypothetical protein [Candidatus Spongiihabitans sp.]|uniref:hypothetical protein n=1 Tax=Candidatus Spongiihabitans sp. TaxID=3101308 RepID=UPI003C6F63B9